MFLAISDLTRIFKTKTFYDLLAVNMPTYGRMCTEIYIHNYVEKSSGTALGVAFLFVCFGVVFFFGGGVVIVLLTVNLHHFPHLHKFVSQTQHKHTE